MYYRKNEQEFAKQIIELPIEGLIFECQSKNCIDSNKQPCNLNLQTIKSRVL